MGIELNLPFKVFARCTELKRPSSTFAGFLILLSFLAQPFIGVFAQHPIYKQFQVEDGLPGVEVYEAHQDRKGFLWIATDKGLARYDGYAFESFSIMDGLLDNSILAIYEDDFGRLWFPASSGGLAYWHNGAFHTYQFNDTLLAQIPAGSSDRIHVEASGTVWVVPLRGGGLLSISPEGKPEWHFTDFDESSIFLKRFTNDEALIGLCHVKHTLPPKTQTNLCTETFAGRQEINMLKNKLVRDMGEVAVLANGQIIFSNGDRLFRLEGSNIVEEVQLQGTVRSICLDHQEQLWVSTQNELCVFQQDGFQNPKRWFRDLGVCFAEPDREGGIWIPSLTLGLFYLPPMPWISINGPGVDWDDRPVSAIDVEEHVLAKGFFNGDVELQRSISQGGSSRMHYLKTGHMPEVVINQGIVWAGKKETSKTVDGELKESVFGRWGRVLRVHKTSRGTTLFATTSGFLELDEEKMLWSSRDVGFFDRTTAIVETQNGELLLGSPHGLFKLVDSTRQLVHPEVTGHVVDIVNGPDTSEWILTHGNGVYVLHDSVCINLDSVLNLTSKMCTHGFLGQDGSMWIGTNIGLNRVIVESWKPFKLRLEKYSAVDGLPSSQVNDIDEWNDTLLVATNKGIAAIALSELSTNRIAPRLLLNEVIVNQQPYSVDGPFHLNHNQDEMLIHFTGVSFRHGGELLYRYQLRGQDVVEMYTTERVVRYTNLAPGEYAFYLAASNGDGVWSESEMLLEFTIQAHFTDETWFRVLVVTIAVLALTLICWLVINYQRIHERDKRLRMIAEQKALLAQMNPHFMFNSLNAIQLFIARNQKSEANLYLSQFSRLMRMVLTYSGKRWVTLQEELETLKLYLQLEKLRFEDQVEYSIHIDPRLDTEEVIIPPMLLQPLLENAIWHGLTPKQTPGKLSLTLQVEQGCLRCIVEDDGVGRARSKAINQKRSESHKASGLENIQERLRLIFPKQRDQKRMQIEDLMDGEVAIGTRVSLLLPLNSLASD